VICSEPWIFFWPGKDKMRASFHRLAPGLALLSLAFGLFLVYQIGFVSGLFSAAPKWIPG